jgi:hypothetical protein
MRDYTKRNKDKHNISSRDWARRHNVGGKANRGIHKRSYPKACEMCGEERHLDYHHWNDNNVSLGVWVCLDCHRLAEFIDTNKDAISLTQKYLELKARINSEWLPLLSDNSE